MSRLVVYDNELLFDKEIRCKLFREIGRGSEGICYEYNGFAYKVLFDKNIIDYIGGILDYMKNPSQILTVDDIDLPSFAFPEKVYATKDWLLGYKTKLIKNNLFNGEIFYSPEDLANINFNSLARAYKVMLQDVDLLSEEKIKIFDLTFNLVFDGKKLTGIDTCDYKRVKKDIKKTNRDSLAASIEDLFYMVSGYKIKASIKNNDIDSYLEDVNKQLRLKK